MNSRHIIDATGFNPVLGDYRLLDARDRTNMYDLWTEYLCLSPTVMPCLSTCVFEAIAEPPEEWYDEDGELVPTRSLDGKLSPPAYYEGMPVACVESFICGPLVVSPDGDVAPFALPEKDEIFNALQKLGWPSSEELVRKIQTAANAPPPGSRLPAELVEAYIATAYSANFEGRNIEMRVGQEAPHSDALKDGAAFLTARNPSGERMPVEANHQRNRLLAADIQELTPRFARGQGIGPDKAWPPEESFLAVGLTFKQAVHLGRHYRQNAIVWIADERIPKLVLLR